MINRRELGATIAATGFLGALPAGAEAPTHGWRDDAVWLKANAMDRSGHIFNVRVRPGEAPNPAASVAMVRVQLEKTPSDNLDHSLFYGGQALGVREFVGLWAYYSSLNAPNGQNVLDGKSASARRSSIWLLSWSADTVHMVTPDGEPARGAQPVAIVVKDWRHAVRVANLDVATVLDRPDEGHRLMAMALLRLPKVARDHAAFYTSEQMGRALRLTAPDAGVMAAAGRFRTLPVRSIAALRDDEVAVL